LGWWKCQFGIELYDEPIYLLQGFKTIALGDRPFQDEILNGPRHFDLLNYFLVSPFLPDSILAIRRAAICLYGLILFGFTFVCCKRKWGWLPGLAFLTTFLFDLYLLPTWSHNWWVRDFLLLHHTFILGIGQVSEAASKRILALLAGLAAGICILAYNPLMFAFLGSLLLIWVLDKYVTRGGLCCPLSLLVFYGLGAGAVVGIDLIYLWSTGLIAPWLKSVSALRELYRYSDVTSLAKIKSISNFFMGRKEFWVVIFLGVFASAPIPIGRWSKLVQSLLLVAVVIVLGRFWWVKDATKVLITFISVGMGGALVVIYRGWVRREWENFTIAIVSVAVALAMGMSSFNGAWSLFWALGGPIILWVTMRNTELVGQWISCALLLFISLGSIYHQWTHTYQDVNVQACDTTLGTPPFTGLKTSARRAFLIEEIQRWVASESYLLAVTELPGAIFPGQVRSAINSAMVLPDVPLEHARESLHYMQVRRRIPSMVVRVKEGGWSWGTGRPAAVRSVEDSPYLRFALCARAAMVLELPEFEIFRLDKKKIDPCVASALTSVLSQ
jgi:hypothetical protein